MNKRAFLSAYTLLLVVLSSSVAFALDPMGPPTAGLKKGHSSIGIEYFYEKGDLELDNGKAFGYPAESVDMRIRMHMVTAIVGYGLTDNWEVFLRIGSGVSGTANGSYNDTAFSGYYSGKLKFDCGSSFVIGAGTKATFYEQQKLKVGGLIQVSRYEHDSDTKHTFSDDTFLWDTEVSVIEFQCAAGPTYQWTDNVSIYGGPFLSHIDGDVDGKYERTYGSPYKFSYDINDEYNFGGYIGTIIDLGDNLSCTIEYLHASTYDAIGTCLLWTY